MTDRFSRRARQLAAAATQALGWQPDTFWNATPSDLANAMGAEASKAAMVDRRSLEALRAALPDEGK